MEVRSRITIWQVLVAGMIFVIIVAVTLPVLHQWRLISQSQLCADNLRKIGLALHQYHDKAATFPPGITSIIFEPKEMFSDRFFHTKAQSCDYPDQPRVSAFTLLLPTLEEYAISDSYNFNVACCAIANRTATSAVVKTYLCPLNDRTHTAYNSYYQSKPAAVDYALSTGSNALQAPLRHFFVYCGPGSFFPRPFHPGVGAFSVDNSISSRSIRDGLANTLFVGEAAGGPQIGIATPKLGFTFETVDGTGSLPSDSGIDQGWSQGYIPNDFNGGSASVLAATAFDHWMDERRTGSAPGPSPGYTPLRLQVSQLRRIRHTSYPRSTPTQIPPHIGPYQKPTELSSDEISMSPFRSLHPRSALFLMGDGSVISMTADIDLGIYQALSSVNGGEADDLDKQSTVHVLHESAKRSY